MKKLIAFPFLLALACAAPQAPPPAVAADGLLANLWMQRSAERAIDAVQSYALASLRLVEALADPTWTAALEQPRAAPELPPAVIADVDETLLDNSPYQAWLVRQDRGYDGASWAAWVKAAEASPLPGAVEFARDASARGATLFYVTNRDEALREATLRNLREAGFPLERPELQLLMKGQNGWGSAKGPRRAYVAETHRIVLLIGDNLLDFAECEGCDLSRLRALAEAERARWGRQWIVVANPAYGSWDDAARGHRRDLPPAEQRRLKLEALRPWSGEGAPR